MSELGGGYERRDANIRVIWKFVGGLFSLIAISLLLMLGLFRFLFQQETEAEPDPTPMEARRVLPPSPRLQVNNVVDLTELRRKEDQILNNYGWVDKNAGVVRIPIERAKELLLQRGLPLVKAPAGEGAKKKQ